MRLPVLVPLVMISLCCLFSTAHAELIIEITRGMNDAVPVAVVPFGTQGTKPALDVAEVVANDLARSGRFAPLERRDMIEQPAYGDKIQFADWRLLKVNYILVGKIINRAADRFDIQFDLFNALNGQRLLGANGMQIAATTTTMRITAHSIADIVFEQLTGIRGVASTRIAYVNAEGSAPNLSYKLIVSDADGANFIPVATSSEPIMSPSWSPDGINLAYVSFENKTAVINVKNLQTGEIRRVSARAGINGAPAWLPDGKQLALTLSRKDGDVDVYTLELATQMLTRITYDPGIDTEPAWSIDGSKLYFTSDRSGNAQIYESAVRDANHVPRRVTFDGNYNARARISPDGKQLAMVHQEGSSFNIATLDLKSGAVQVITKGKQDESPSYAPNGAQLIFATQSRGHGVLSLICTDGRGQQILGASSGDVREAVWGPFPRKQ